jgi:FkbM family methyltransferase
MISLLLKNSLNKIILFLIVGLILTPFCSYSNEQQTKIIYYNLQIPKNTELRERVLTTLYCDDSETIPKCEGAGQVICIEGKYYQLMHNGIKICLDSYYGKWMTLLIQLLKGHHEPQEEKVFYEVLPSMPAGAVMVELGAFWCYYSLWFQKDVPCANTYLIEPDYKNLLVGKEHFLCNNCVGNITHAMIGSCSIENNSFTNWNYETSLVKQISIDDFAKENGIPFIHLLHSDIQGAEVDMLKGCKQLMKEKRIGYFFISTHRGTHEKCLEAFENTDYDILLSITREESFAADGLIIAKSPEMKGPTVFDISRRTQEIINFISEVVHEKNTD